MWSVAVVGLVCNGCSVAVEARRLVLLLEDLTDLFHVSVLNEY